MPVLCSNASNSKESTSRIRATSIIELEKLVKLSKEKGITLESLANNKYLSNIDLMLLDSAFKEFNLDKADKTLLIIEDRYITMLHKLIWILIETLT
jgi:hypothetical protein